MLSFLLESAARSMGLGLLVWMVLRLCRIRSPQTQSLAWMAVLLSALTMPMLTEIMRALMSGAPTDATTRIPGVVSPLLVRPLPPPSSVGQQVSTDGITVPLAIYLLVAAAFFFRLLAGLLRSQRLLSAATPLKEPWAAGWDIRISRELAIPVTYGSTILFPAGWPLWNTFKRNAVLLHEQSHVRRRDFYIQLLAGLHRVVFWFSPLAWWLQGELLKLAEASCDDEALRRLEDRTAYAEILVELAGKRSRSDFAGVAMARGRTVEYRVDRILREVSITPTISLPGRVLVMAALIPLVALAAGSWVVEARTAPAIPSVTLTVPRQNPPAPQPQQPQPTRLAPAAEPTQYLATWPDQEVPDIISDEERRAFQILPTDEEREEFIRQFWLRRDPTPGTVDNEFRNEYFRRINRANQLFGTPARLGWRTDRGRILIKHGEPDELESHPSGERYIRTEAGTVVRTKTLPFESWRYRLLEGIGENLTLEFVDVDATGEFRLANDPGEKSR